MTRSKIEPRPHSMAQHIHTYTNAPARMQIHAHRHTCSSQHSPRSHSEAKLITNLLRQAPPGAMDPASVRALLCAAKFPLGRAGEELIQHYVEGHRSCTMVDTSPEAPADRCIAKVGRGRCCNRVSKAALVQQCWKHQPGGGLLNPGDAKVCHWNQVGVFQTRR